MHLDVPDQAPCRRQRWKEIRKRISTGSLVRGSAVLLAASLGMNVTNFVFHAIVGRLLGPSGYGELTPIVNVVAVLALPIAALEAAVTQAVAERSTSDPQADVRSLIGRSIIGGLILAGLWVALTPLVAGFLHLPSPVPAALLAPWLATVAPAAVLQGVLLGQRRYAPVAVCQIGSGVARLASGIAFVEIGLGVSGAVAATAMSGVAILGILAAASGPILAGRGVPVAPSAGDSIRSMASLAGVTVLTSVDVWLARRFLAPAGAGLFSSASTLGRVALFIPGAVMAVVFPALVAAGEDRDAVRRLLLRAAGYVSLLSLGAAGVLAAFSALALRTLFGASFLAARPVVGWVALAYAAACLLVLLVYFFLAQRSRWSWFGWAASLAAVAAALVFHSGPRALALDMLVVNALSAAVLSVVAMSRLLHLPARWDSRRSQAKEATRRLALTAGAGSAGAVALIVAGDVMGISRIVADVALSMAALAIAAGWLHLRLSHDPEPVASRAAVAPPGRPGLRRFGLASWAAPAVVAAVGVAAASSWFRPGTALAGGDIAPPQGLAWIGHIFAPWSGSNLGGPNGSATQLPWAIVLEVVHLAGGSAVLAQRLWLTCLFAGIGLGGYLLLRVLRLTPVAAAAGALVYLLNPYTVSMAGINSVFLAAMALLPVLAAITLGAVTARYSIRSAVVLLVLTCPLIGYVYSNPPLVLLLAGGTLFAAGYGIAVGGRPARRRAIRFGLLGLPLLAAACAYWAVPALIQSGTAASGSLSQTSSWAWTEGRATLANGFWLNTTWGWSYRTYYPFAPSYSTFPLDVIKYLLPVAALAALPISFARSGSPASRRLAVGAAAVAAFLIFVSTGTRSPGNIVFEPVYHLPYGWLLREPGRFLMGAALAYSVLLGVSVERLAVVATCFGERNLRSPRSPWSALRGPVPTWALGAVALVALISPGFPLAFGQLTPNHRPGGFPGSHVVLPRYWTQMASYINRSPQTGGALVLPSDDFYQMPYSWGYYGNDGFITQLVSRPVIDPTGQGYQATSAQLLLTVQHISADLAGRDWPDAQRLLGALDVRMVLVRGDVVATFPGRNIVSPAAINVGLSHDPDATLVHRDGPLSLYVVTPPPAGPVVTIDSTQPDLNALALLPNGTRLVSSRPLPGIPAVVQPPPLTAWQSSGNVISTTVPVPSGYSYRLATTSPWSTGSSSAPPGEAAAGPEAFRVAARGPTSATISADLGANQVADGSLRAGLWQQFVGDCNDVGGLRAKSALSAKLIPGSAPGGRPAMRLQAGTDSACEATPVSYQGGTLLLSALIDDQGGAPARLCLWEQNLNRCAAFASPLPTGPGWKQYRTEVKVDPGARSLVLFAYADSTFAGQTTTIDYADIRVNRLANSFPVLIARPTGDPAPTREQLRVSPLGFGSYWTGPAGDHVQVDGLLDGWLGTPAQISAPLLYRYESAVRVSQYLSIAAGGVSVVLIITLFGEVALARRRTP